MTTTTAAPVHRTCKERIGKELRSTIKTLRRLWELNQQDPDDSDPDLGSFNEYGLGFDYVAAGTFTDQREGYFRYQLSWGGPSDEFRFYTDAARQVTRIEYRFMDWFDGAKRILKGGDLALLMEIWNYFAECGSVEAAFDKAREEGV
jgi:hypothetical protein